MKNVSSDSELLHRFQVKLERFQDQNVISSWCVALSGGLDSIALLHLLVNSGTNLPIRAIHVNHGISRNSNDWQSFCSELCTSYQVELFETRVEIPEKGSLEENARKARYQTFEDFLKPNEVLLMAHHLNDQAETFLQRVCRGSGLTGLASIPECRPLSQGHLFRPLLSESRDTLKSYVAANSLDWVEDESNSSFEYDRNYIRHNVIPALIRRWPAFLNTLNRTTQLIRQDSEALNYYRAAWLKGNNSQEKVSIKALLALPAFEQQGVLSYWSKSKTGASLSNANLETLLREVCLAKQDARAVFQLQDNEFRRYQGHLYCIPKDIEFDPEWHLSFDLSSDVSNRFELPSGDIVYLKSKLGGFVLPDGQLELRFRLGGERIRPVLDNHTRELKKWLQSNGVPPWERARIPLLYCNDKLIAVADYTFDQSIEGVSNQNGWEFIWQRKCT